MWFKLLLIFYTILTVNALYQFLKGLVKEKDLSETYKLAELGLGGLFIFSLIVATPITVLLISLYAQVSHLSNTLAWLSAIQIVIAIAHWLNAVFIVPSKLIAKTYKYNSKLYTGSMVAFDIFYLWLIIQHLIR